MWNTPILSTISLNLSLYSVPLDLSCLFIQYLVKDENSVLHLEGILALEQLHQNLVNISYVSSWCVNSRQISDDIFRDLNFATRGNIESCPATGFLLLCSRIQSKFFFLASAKISSAVTSTNVLARGPQRSPALNGGTTEITEGSMLPTSRTVLSRFSYLYLPPPTLFRTAPVQ